MHCDGHGVGAEAPLSAIARLAAQGASGELIAASDAVEVHVYLLDGRLAWATTSTAPNAFVQRLVDHHGVAPDAIREVIEECQRSRRRLGETLVGWGLATIAQVRDSLGAQIAEVLAAAAAHPGAQTLFLPRRMSYARELTFDLAELLPSREPTDLDQLAGTIVATVLDSIPETLWVEVTASGEAVARASRSAVRPSDELGLLHRTLDEHGLDALVVRSCAGVVLGHRIPGRDAAVWCGASPDVKLGLAAALLANAAGGAPPARQGGELPESWRERPGANGVASNAVLAGAMRNSDDLVAGLVLDRDGGAGGAWRGPDDLEAHAEVARLLAPVLRARLRDSLARPTVPLGYDHVALRGQRGALAYHGTAAAGVAGSVWLVLPSWASQGLGWALLHAVSRQAADAAGVGP